MHITPQNRVPKRYSFEGSQFVSDFQLSVNSKKILGLMSMMIPTAIKMIERIKYIYNAPTTT